MAAQERGLDFVFVREGRAHERWACDGAHVSIPRHREINPYTAEGICKDLEDVLGWRWWR